MVSLKPVVNLVRLGSIKYTPALKLQQLLTEKIKRMRPKSPQTTIKKFDTMKENYILVLEHTPVFTIGLRNRDIYAEEAKNTNFAALGAEYVETDRGGLITFHGPGQLVVYPILDLKNFVPNTSLFHGKKANLMGMRWYVDTLEQTVIDLLKEKYSLDAHRSPHTGVWMGNEEKGDERKICAMGVHNSQLVTSHGLALNCNTDLTWFDHIVPCGIEGKGVTSISKELSLKGNKANITIESVIPHYIESFQKHFQCDINESDNSDYKELLSNHSEQIK